MNKAPSNCSKGISMGKLKGAMMTTGPKGHLQSSDYNGINRNNDYQK
jgi:hypothetical protein